MRVAFALAIAAIAAGNAASGQNNLIAAGTTHLYTPLPRETGFVATTARSTRTFRRWLIPADRQRVTRFNYSRDSLLAVFVRGVGGSHVLLESVRREHATLDVRILYIPGATLDERLHYRVWRVPKAKIGLPAPRRIVVRTRPLFGPPPAFLEHTAGPLRLATGSTCWSRGDRAYCADLISPWNRRDVPETSPHAGTPLVIRLAFVPASASATFFRGEHQTQRETVELPRTNPLRWTVPRDFRAPNVGYLSISVATGSRPAGSGQVSYELRLVAPSR
jgi:hypothetical protein